MIKTGGKKRVNYISNVTSITTTEDATSLVVYLRAIIVLQETWRNEREERGLFRKLEISGRTRERKAGGEWVVLGSRFVRAEPRKVIRSGTPTGFAINKHQSQLKPLMGFKLANLPRPEAFCTNPVRFHPTAAWPRNRAPGPKRWGVCRGSKPVWGTVAQISSAGPRIQ